MVPAERKHTSRADETSPPPLPVLSLNGAPDSPLRLPKPVPILPLPRRIESEETASCSGSSGWTSPTSSAGSNSTHSQASSGSAGLLLIQQDAPGSSRSVVSSKSFSSPSSARARLFVSEAVSDLQQTSSSSPMTNGTKTKRTKKKSKQHKNGRAMERRRPDVQEQEEEDESSRPEDESQSLLDSIRSLDVSDSESDDASSKISTDLHKMIRKRKWNKLIKAVDQLLRKGTDHDRRSALTKCNKYGESTLHVATWNAPAAIVSSMLQLVPPDEAKDFVLEVDNNGNTVLHFACASLEQQDEFAVVREIASMAPEAIELQNRDGDSPLHSLMSSKAFHRSPDFVLEAMAEDLITLLLDMKRSAGVLGNNEAATLLHVAIASEAHERVLMRLIHLAPESIIRADEQGMLPIHYLAAFGGTLPWTVAQEILRLFPECVHRRTNNGDTPLHLLVENSMKYLNDIGVLHRNTTKLAELLVGSSRSKDCPLTAQNNHKLTPLHIAALRDTPNQLLKVLLSLPGGEYATAITAEFQATPVHLLCASPDVSFRLEALEALASTKACSMFDSIGRTPLVIAVQNEKASKEVITTLLEIYPRAATMPCRAGHLPIHLAVQKENADIAIVKVLLAVHPTIARAVNGQRNTPLHEAAIHGAPIKVLALLLEKYPDAIQEMNKKGQRPLNCARERNAPTAVLDLLDETTMSMSSTFRPRHLSFSSGPYIPGGSSMAEF